jgi:hypothetical protein
VGVKDPEALIHFPKMVSEFLDILPVLQTVLIVRWHNVAHNVLVLLVDLVGHCHNLVVHLLHFSLQLFPQHFQARLFLLALSDGLPYLLVVIDVAVSQDSLKLILVLDELLLDSRLLKSKLTQLLLLLFILASSMNAGLKQAKQLISALFLVLSRIKIIKSCT